MVKKDYFCLLLILFFSFLLRVIFLSSIPLGFHVDEARAGYNSYSLLKTGKDENGNLLPLFYNSFSEYRPTGYFYSTIPFVLIFGLNETSTRAAGAIYGTLTVLICFLLAFELTKKKEIAFLSSILIAFSLWHIILSRSTSEAIGSLFWITLGIYLLLVYIRKDKLLFFIFSCLSLFISLFFYPSARFIVPAIIFILIFYTSKRIRLNLILACIMFSIFSFGILSLISGNNNRLNEIAFYKNTPSIIQQSEKEGIKNTILRVIYNKPFLYLKSYLNQFLNYTNPTFLTSSDIKPKRYSFPNGQLITFSELFLIVVGLYLFKKTRQINFLIYWILISIVLPALTIEDSPNMQRSVFMLPALIILSAFYLSSIKNKFKNGKLIFIFILLIYVLELLPLYHSYFFLQKFSVSAYRNEKSKEVALRVLNQANKYNYIVITNKPDNHYIYLFFYKPYNPEIAQQVIKSQKKEGDWGFDNFTFTDEECPSSSKKFTLFKGKILFIDMGDCKLTEEKEKTLLNSLLYTNGAQAYNFIEITRN